MKHLSIIRSLVTNEGSHERGRVLMHTARAPSVVVSYPSIGAVTSQQLTAKDVALPGFISIGRPADGPGFLGMNYAPFSIQNPGTPPPNIRPPSGIGGNDVEQMERIRRRQRLFYDLEDNFRLSRAPHLNDEKDIGRKATRPRRTPSRLLTQPVALLESWRTEDTSLATQLDRLVPRNGA